LQRTLKYTDLIYKNKIYPDEYLKQIEEANKYSTIYYESGACRDMVHSAGFKNSVEVSGMENGDGKVVKVSGMENGDGKVVKWPPFESLGGEPNFW